MGSIPVEVAIVASGRIEGSLRFSANLEAERAVQVIARAAGQVERLVVEEGDRVKQGQVLLRLEDAEAASALARAENDLAQAERQFRQTQQLHERGVASEQQLETATYERTRAELARVDAARALQYTTVRSSIDGVVTARMVKLGDFVNLNQQLFGITDFDSIVALVYVPEKDLPSLAPGQNVRLSAPTSGEELPNGTVARVAPVVDPRTGTVKVTIAVPSHPATRPGMFVDVELVVAEHANAVLLPKRALVYDNDEPYAFKLGDDGKVTRIRVEPVMESRDLVEPRAGFKVGDRVVVAGQVGLKDGAKVEPTEVGAPAAKVQSRDSGAEPKATPRAETGAP